MQKASQEYLESFKTALFEKMDSFDKKLDTMLSRIDIIQLENAQLKEENEHLKEKVNNLVSSKNDLELKVEECKHDARGACITSNNNKQYSRRTSVRVHGENTT